MKSFVEKVFFHIKEKLGIGQLSRGVTFLKEIAVEDYFQKNVLENPKYSDPKRLNMYEYNVFSQSGEDGIISEIFKRIGTTNKFFVEFGVSNGLENCSAALLYSGWNGRWIEGSDSFYKQIQKNFEFYIGNKQLEVKNAFITAESIESLFGDLSVPKDFDLLSIDIDGNDFWVWKAIKKYNPRVVIIEGNPFYGPSISWTMKYNPEHVWDRTTYFGASVKALEILGREKGYTLVGCSIMGNDTFFVRNDLVKDLFAAPFTSENHYESFKVHLQKKYKYKKSVGEGVFVK